MSALISLSEVSKRHGAQTLFDCLSLSITEKDRIGVIGPNGAGKSTLLRLLAGDSEVDSGSIIRRRGLRVSYAPQSAVFDEERSLFELAYQKAFTQTGSAVEADRAARSSLSRLRLDQFDTPAGDLSGGQRKRLQLALALCESPDLLLLDEPTNHLDLESIIELERLLDRASFAWVVVSHDRWFLEAAAEQIIEVNRIFPAGVFCCDGSYGTYLERRTDFLAAEQKRRESLENTVRVEQAWLRQGVKARTTKAKHRIDKALALMDSLAMVRSRAVSRSVDISFSASDRKTKRLLELFDVSKGFDGKALFTGIEMPILSGQAIGVLGRNGSGKTTFFKLLTGELTPDSGTIRRAPGLSIAHFQQFDDSIDPALSLKNVLSEESDSVVFRGESVHVASWAQRFRFSFDQLKQPYGSLSGGERSRARIARLMLSTADILILDEPTNDLDIETLDTLEQSLLDFPGAVVLATHDRFMINRVCSHFIGFDGRGGWQQYADFEQWRREVAALEQAAEAKDSLKDRQSATSPAQRPETAPPKKKLSYKEQRELDSMEARIAEAELKEANAELELPQTQRDAARVQALCTQLAELQHTIETLYSRWSELDEN